MASNYTIYCCVHGCRNKRTNDKLTFFPLPSDVKRRAEWLEAIGRNDLLSSEETGDIVCSKHFGKKSMSEVSVRKLMPDAVPSKYLPTSPLVYINPLTYEHDEGISDVATQTNNTYGLELLEMDVFVDVFERTVLIKDEKDPEIPKNSTFMPDRALKRQPEGDGNNMGETKNKKRKS